MRAFVILIALGLGGCGFFRPIFMGIANDNRTGEAAPTLMGEVWVAPPGITEGHPQGRRWTLLTFFLPQ